MIYMLSKRLMKTVHIIYIQETVFSACAFLARPEGATASAYDLVLIWSLMCWNHVWLFYYTLLNKEAAHCLIGIFEQQLYIVVSMQWDNFMWICLSCISFKNSHVEPYSHAGVNLPFDWVVLLTCIGCALHCWNSICA